MDSLREAFGCFSPKEERKPVTKYVLHHHWNGWFWDDFKLLLAIIGSLNSSGSDRVANTLVETYMPSQWRRMYNSERQADLLESSSRNRWHRMGRLAGSSGEPALASVWPEVQGTYVEAFSCSGSWASMRLDLLIFSQRKVKYKPIFVCSFWGGETVKRALILPGFGPCVIYQRRKIPLRPSWKGPQRTRISSKGKWSGASVKMRDT